MEWDPSGVTHRVTGPVATSHAVATVRRIRHAWRCAAPSAPSAGINRVLVRRATGALARIAMATGSGLAWRIAVTAGERGGLDAEPVGEPQAPHGQDGAQHALLLSAAH